MTFKSRPTELTPDERRAYAALPRDTAVDDAEEDRTVRALHARGLLGALPTPVRRSRTWWRATAIVSAAAAGVIAVLQSALLHPVTAPEMPHSGDSIAPTDTRANAPAAQTIRTAFGVDPRRTEKTSLLVWY